MIQLPTHNCFSRNSFFIQKVFDNGLNSGNSGKMIFAGCLSFISGLSLFGSKEASLPLGIMITGGGTGGHLFPGIAIAESLIEREKSTRILFVSTGNKFERSALSEKGFNLETVSVEGIKGRGILLKLKSCLKVPKAIVSSISIIRRFKPDIVIGMGGYSSGPVAFAAWLLGIKIVLHEQNLKPGITNRILSYFAERIYTSFHNTRTGLKPSKLLMTGNPVRREILETISPPDEAEDLIQENLSQFTIVVLGGSQGAHSINMAVIEAFEHLTPGQNYHFIHQTGVADETLVKDTYQQHGMSGTVKSFFHDMATLYRQADLIICRAGATTVAEVTSIGKSVIFIPYPFAADNHQVLNAKALVDKGAAEMIVESDLSGKGLARRIEALSMDPELIQEMRKKSKKFGRPEAAEKITNDIFNLLKGA